MLRSILRRSKARQMEPGFTRFNRFFQHLAERYGAFVARSFFHKRRMGIVYGALIVLTVITVAIRYVDLGEANLLVALAIAGLKATLVSLFFMHLRWDRPFNQLIFLSGILFVVLMMAFCLMDTSQYRDSQYTGNPVDVQAVLDKDAPNAPIATKKSPDLP